MEAAGRYNCDSDMAVDVFRTIYVDDFAIKNPSCRMFKCHIWLPDGIGFLLVVVAGSYNCTVRYGRNGPFTSNIYLLTIVNFHIGQLNYQKVTHKVAQIHMNAWSNRMNI